MKFEFSRKIFEKPQLSNFKKILPVYARFFHAGGRTDGQTGRQTDMTKLIVPFQKFANAAKNSTFFSRSTFISSLINRLKTKRRPLYLKTHFVPRSKHFSSRL